ncbi:MAG: hypothetical protein ABFC71_00470, partial [Methanoregula sp.]
ALKARKYRLQIKEIKIKIILYNISKLISSLSFLIFIEEFYRAYFRIFYKKNMGNIRLQFHDRNNNFPGTLENTNQKTVT